MLLMVFCSNNVNAASPVSENGITITNITANSATIDWGSTVNVMADSGYVLQNYTVTWWTAVRGTNIIVQNSTATNANVTNLPSGTTITVEVYLNTVDGSKDEFQGYYSTTFETDETQDLDVNINNGTASTSTNITLPTPKINKAIMSGTELGVIAIVKDTTQFKQLEWEVYDVENDNKLVRTDISYKTTDIIYGMERKIYGVRVRGVGYGDAVSDWSSIVYTIAQPKVSTSKKLLKQNSITVKFSKIKGAKNYTIYIRKHGKKKWTKITTTTKTKYKITKFKGKKINLKKTNYDYCVIANVKKGGKNIKSYTGEYFYTKYYYK